MTASNKHGVVKKRYRPATDLGQSSYKIRNCLNMHKIFDILTNATSHEVANLCGN